MAGGLQHRPTCAVPESRGGRPGIPALLKPATVKQMTTAAPAYDQNAQAKYARGCMVRNNGAGSWWHNGSLPGRPRLWSRHQRRCAGRLVGFAGSDQSRERKRSKLRSAVFLHINLCHHEWVRYLIAANYSEQFHLRENNGGCTEELNGLLFDIRFLVLDHSTLDDVEFPRLIHGGPHVNKHALIVKQSG